MSAHVHTAVNNPDLIALLVRLSGFNSCRHKITERISRICQVDSLAAGDCHAAGYQRAIFVLLNAAVGRRQPDRSASLVDRNRALRNFVRIRNRRIAGFHGAVQCYSFFTGNRDIVNSCFDGCIFLDQHMLLCSDSDIACPCNHLAVDLCIVSCVYTDITRIGIYAICFIIDFYSGSRANGDIAFGGFYRPVDCNVFYRFQFHIAAGFSLTVNTGIIIFRKPDCSCFQITLTGRSKVPCHFNQAKPHGGVLATCTVDALHIAIFTFQINKHAVVSRRAAVLFRCSCIVQDTERVCCSADFTLCFIGFQF